MLQTLRNNTRIILWFVVIAFVGFIILVWGADLQVGSSKQGIAGTVNGRDITYQFYEGRVRTNVQNVQTRNDRPATFEEERRISDQTWQSIVDEILIAQEAEKYALPVSDEEVVFWIENNPPPELLQHPAMIDSATGQFSLARYLQLLRTEPQSFRGYEQLTRYQLPVTKLQQHVVSAAKVSDAEVETYVRDRNETMRASFTWVDPKQFPGRGTKVSEEEARAYYEARPDEFRSEERARMVVVRLPTSRPERPPSRGSPRASRRMPSPPRVETGGALCDARRSSPSSPTACSRSPQDRCPSPSASVTGSSSSRSPPTR
jgi:hypothetical protein